MSEFKKHQIPIVERKNISRNEVTGLWFTILSKRNKGDRCLVIKCQNIKAKGRTQCRTCFSRTNRLNNPAHYAWRNLRISAMKRDIFFGITFEEFKQFCLETGYLEVKGKRSLSQTIDRIDNNKGYTLGNMQMMSMRSNVQKYHEGNKV